MFLVRDLSKPHRDASETHKNNTGDAHTHPQCLCGLLPASTLYSW